MSSPAERTKKREAATAAKRRQYRVRVGVTFVLFSLFAAPLQFHVDWYARWTAGEPDWVVAVLGGGPLYFLAFTLCIEGFLRLENYPNLLSAGNRVHLLRLMLIAPGAVFFFRYFVAPYYDTKAPPVEEQFVQVMTAGVAVFLAYVVHQVVTKQEARRLR